MDKNGANIRSGRFDLTVMRLAYLHLGSTYTLESTYSSSYTAISLGGALGFFQSGSSSTYWALVNFPSNDLYEV